VVARRDVFFPLAFGLAVAAGASTTACLSGAPGAATRWDHEPFTREGTTRVVGCAELAFSVERDARLPDGSVLLDVSVRNRCVRPTPLDLGAMRIVGYDAAGAEFPVAMYDPRGEIHAAEVDSEVAAVERIRLDGFDAVELPSSLCVDVTRVSQDAQRASPARVCMPAPGADR
jgi:hypothetical protein